MSRLIVEPRFPREGRALVDRLTTLYREMAQQVNDLAAGKISAAYEQRTASPTGIVLQTGDIIRNAAPSETGTAGSKYTLIGWMAKSDGTASAASVLELRIPTGN